MLASLIRKYRQKGVLPDTNLLFGYLIGSMHPRYLSICHAATKSFRTEDFPRLVWFLDQFDRMVTTPHVLTEISNLAQRLPDGLHQRFRLLFREAIGKLSERLEPSKRVSTDETFLRFGLTDAAISTIAPGRFLVFTDDHPLFGLLHKRGADVVHFDHIRTGAWETVP